MNVMIVYIDVRVYWKHYYLPSPHPRSRENQKHLAGRRETKSWCTEPTRYIRSNKLYWIGRNAILSHSRKAASGGASTAPTPAERWYIQTHVHVQQHVRGLLCTLAAGDARPSGHPWPTKTPSDRATASALRAVGKHAASHTTRTCQYS